MLERIVPWSEGVGLSRAKSYFGLPVNQYGSVFRSRGLKLAAISRFEEKDSQLEIVEYSLDQ